ncbi:MAG: gamma-glutamylcyclotransferase [Spirochaetota bacterium]
MKYFAYGSNMNAARMEERHISYRKRTRATLADHRLCFDKIASGLEGAGYANVIPSKGEAVEGILYSSVSEAGIQLLDEKEHVYTRHYTREKVRVNTEAGTEEAWIYIAGREYRCDGLKPTSDYLAHLLQGDDILSETWVDELRDIETVDTHLFVYGTLKKGHSNHRLLSGSRCIGTGHTLRKYTMYADGIPYVKSTPATSVIQGEIYRITDEILERCDALEGHPRWYRRKQTLVQTDGKPTCAWLYFCDTADGTILPEGRWSR